MKYFAIRNNIEQSLYDNFIQFYNEHKDEEVRIIIDSGGGEMSATKVFISIINSMHNVSLIILNAYSAAFVLAYNCKCKKYLYQYSRGMWHYSRSNMDINANGKPTYYESECILRNYKLHQKEQEKLAKKIMTNAEYKLFKDGQDVYFDINRMKRIFPDATILK